MSSVAGCVIGQERNTIGRKWEASENDICNMNGTTFRDLSIVMKFSVFHGTRRFVTTFTTASHWSLSCVK
jgi:hypothetical protein